jgi:hypothetical protein
MKFTKVFIQLFAAGLLISSTSCQQQYPDLGDGIFAEFVTSKDTIIIQLFYRACRRVTPYVSGFSKRETIL